MKDEESGAQQARPGIEKGSMKTGPRTKMEHGNSCFSSTQALRYPGYWGGGEKKEKRQHWRKEGERSEFDLRDKLSYVRDNHAGGE